MVAVDDQRPGDVALGEVLVEGPAADEFELVLPVGGAAEVEGVEEGNRAAGAGAVEKRGGRVGRVILDPPGEEKGLSHKSGRLVWAHI